MCVCVCVYIYIYIYIYRSVCVCVCIYIYIYIIDIHCLHIFNLNPFNSLYGINFPYLIAFQVLSDPTWVIISSCVHCKSTIQCFMD